MTGFENDGGVLAFRLDWQLESIDGVFPGGFSLHPGPKGAAVYAALNEGPDFYAEERPVGHEKAVVVPVALPGDGLLAQQLIRNHLVRIRTNEEVTGVRPIGEPIALDPLRHEADVEHIVSNIKEETEKSWMGPSDRLKALQKKGLAL